MITGRNVSKFQKLAIERLVTQFYMISKGIMCRVVQILFSHLCPEGTRTKRTMDKTDQTKRTTFQDKTDHVPGQNGSGFRTKGPRFWKKRALFYLGQTGQCKKIDDVLQRSKESSQYCVSS